MMTKKNPRVARLYRDLSKMGNDVFRTREYKHFLSTRLTRKRAAYYIFERSHFHLNRRQCWALVQARAPFDVKQLIWHHEMEELEGDKERGVDNHWVLGMKEGAVVGMKPRDFQKPPGVDLLQRLVLYRRTCALARSALLILHAGDREFRRHHQRRRHRWPVWPEDGEGAENSAQEAAVQQGTYGGRHCSCQSPV
jgi:hypothetical protein